MRNAKRLRPLVVAAVLAAVPLTAMGTTIVFDPTNYAKAVEQLRQDVQMVTELRTQIQNQLQMIQNWGFSQLTSILQSMDGLRSVFDDARDVYASVSSPVEQLKTLFPESPATFATMAESQVADLRQQWQERGRAALVENRNVQNQVQQDLAPTADRIQQYVEKSNAAPGVTAAVQAGNEELATVVAQVQALQALEITDGRTDAELQAQLQAEDAYGIAEGQKVLQGMGNHSKSTNRVQNPFALANE
jgi:P-type conjugative transfer protein TrbJ